MRIELVTTIRSSTPSSAPARCHVVVPAVRPIAVPGRMSAAAAAAIASFSSTWVVDLTTNPGSTRGRGGIGGERRAAVDLVEHAGLVERLEIAPDRHVAHTEHLGEIADPRRPVPEHVFGDQLAPPAGQHATLRPTGSTTGTCHWHARLHRLHDASCSAIAARKSTYFTSDSAHVSCDSVRIRWILLDLVAGFGRK